MSCRISGGNVADFYEGLRVTKWKYHIMIVLLPWLHVFIKSIIIEISFNAFSVIAEIID